MSTSFPTTAPAAPRRPERPTARAAPGRRALSLTRHLPLLGAMALSAVMNLRHLSQNGYGNSFYAAADKSMLMSLHNFFFASSDPGGLITVDKPPMGLWAQTISAKLFGFSPAAVMLPQAILGVLSVAALYWILVRRFGLLAALVGSVTLAVFPSFVAVSRDTNVDALLIFLMILACGLGCRATESGRLRWLLACAFVIGLAFNTKTLAALLIVPGIALAYLVCAPGGIPRRLAHLLAAGLLMLIVCGAWIAVVELTPASQRPYVGSSTNNTELGLTFAYNGFGRVEGQKGGPGRVAETTAPEELLRKREHEALREREIRDAQARRAAERRAAARGLTPPPVHAKTAAPTTRHATTGASPATKPEVAPEPSEFLPNGRRRFPITFGASIGPLRMFKIGLDTQGGWLLPFAFLGLIAFACLLGVARRGRRDPRLAGLIVMGVWFLAEWALLSLSKGIIHPYYVSALGPGTAAMCGAGLVAFVGLIRGPSWRIRTLGWLLLALAVAASVVAQLVILHEDHYLHRIHIPLIAACALGLGAVLAATLLQGRADRLSSVPARLLRATPLALCALLLCALLIVPGFYSASTWEAPVDGTFPEAGPHTAAGDGGVGVAAVSVKANRKIIRFVQSHHPGTRWGLLTQASDIAAPLILLGLHAAALGGYGASDPVLSEPQLARLVERREARYVLIGGAYSTRGGNAASNAVLHVCRLVPASAWQGPHAGQGELVIFDCRGDEAKLRKA